MRFDSGSISRQLRGSLVQSAAIVLLALGAAVAALAQGTSSEGPPNPSLALSAIRATMLEKFDSNKNGRLDVAELAAMRTSMKQASDPRKRGRGFQPPQEWVERYDSDADGELDNREVRHAFEQELKRMVQRYDKDEDGELNAEEKSVVQDDVRAGKHKDIYAFIAMRVSGMNDRRGRAIGESREDAWLRFDTDGDGKASKQELQAIREFERQQKKDDAAAK